MPDFNKQVDVDVDVEITVKEFLEECSFTEKTDLLDDLISECEYDDMLKDSMLDSLKNCFPEIFRIDESDLSGLSYDQEEFKKSLQKLDDRYYSLTNEEISIINNIAKKF